MVTGNANSISDENINVSVISESDVMATDELSSVSHATDINLVTPQDSYSPRHHEDFMTSSGESDLDKKVSSIK